MSRNISNENKNPSDEIWAIPVKFLGSTAFGTFGVGVSEISEFNPLVEVAGVSGITILGWFATAKAMDFYIKRG